MTRIDFARKTHLVEERVKLIRANADRAIAEFKRDGGGMLGDKEPAPDARLNAYWQSVTLPDGSIDMHDVALIMPDEQGRFVTEILLRNGVSQDAPHSPTWQNFLRIEGMFTEKAKDFVRLVKADEERKSKEPASAETVPSSAGLPPPQMVASGSPQPQAGSSPPGYGSYQ